MLSYVIMEEGASVPYSWESKENVMMQHDIVIWYFDGWKVMTDGAH